MMFITKCVPLFLVCVLEVVGKQVPMKIVEEPSSYGWNNNLASNNQQSAYSNSLSMRVTPSNFSGPAHLRSVYGRCFEKLENSYKYEFCPFFNITQHEQTLRWNAYNGILGVWQEWEIQNQTFTAMLMKEGDSCGALYRSVKVTFDCGTVNSLVNISEPETCRYHAVFQTPLVCHPHSMLVYPTLSQSLRDRWDILAGRLEGEELTQQGFAKLVRKEVFEVAGYTLPEAKKTEVQKEKDDNAAEETGDFASLLQCTEAYRKLQIEVINLRAALELHGINVNNVSVSRTSNNNNTSNKIISSAIKIEAEVNNMAALSSRIKLTPTDNGDETSKINDNSTNYRGDFDRDF